MESAVQIIEAVYILTPIEIHLLYHTVDERIYFM